MKYDLENRLIDYSILIINIVNQIPKTVVGSYLAGQLSRSGISVSLNYGEAQSAESRKDFVHKAKIILKELRETFICLKIIHRAHLYKNEEDILKALKETDELIAIFVKSIQTANQNMGKK